MNKVKNRCQNSQIISKIKYTPNKNSDKFVFHEFNQLDSKIHLEKKNS